MSASTESDPIFLRPAEAAELAELSTRAIYRAIQRGELRAVRLCSRLRIPPAAFQQWVELSAVSPPARPSTRAPSGPSPATGVDLSPNSRPAR